MPCCSNIPETVDKDLDDKGAYIRGLGKVIEKFEVNVTATTQAFQSLIKAYENTSQSFVEFAHGTDGQAASLAVSFEGEVRKLKIGPMLSTLQQDFVTNVKEAGRPIKIQQEKVMRLYNNAVALRHAYDKHKYNVEETEKSYAKKDKPLTESKSFIKESKDRDAAFAKYDQAKKTLNAEIKQLASLIPVFIGSALPKYAACSAIVAQQMATELAKFKVVPSST
ncbi:uncharacterized protein TEOVI_000460200 [Trypanosoma equiperdum]|uniref:BAR domain-containing protein n=3 Tax=Trypanozoon TaxID=39700 RepID=A0A3L6KUZ1_9TRYP|nr:hypothetical protein, conserved [Trypanosoma brucei gambiense DAL972]RHW67658.1 hypothetical protein DPX39_110030500 [Trypanosoma brucei equiperdum]RHW67922.1 hypothetical protein DPX39_110030400 [Trypanosoma brucei equiperdum]CBH17149.1 hypothetical protein, conserved [Trypanosoma brucei gambiense DAL972]SCU73018.1 hypothetical protein, conserved [Trypanosoma equiperdum]|eukprot:XP_011779413.1 hypothetical protein, conserved [Trypanosoma brucei gambiense DAL972]